jgi:hypothetical protein
VPTAPHGCQPKFTLPGGEPFEPYCCPSSGHRSQVRSWFAVQVPGDLARGPVQGSREGDPAPCRRFSHRQHLYREPCAVSPAPQLCAGSPRPTTMPGSSRCRWRYRGRLTRRHAVTVPLGPLSRGTVLPTPSRLASVGTTMLGPLVPSQRRRCRPSSARPVLGPPNL